MPQSKVNISNDSELLSFYNNGDFKNVILLAKKIIEKEHKNYNAYNFLGLAYRSIGENSMAEKVFLDIIRKDPRNSSLNAIYTNTANLFYEIGQIDKAFVFYKASLELDRANIDASLGMGLALSNTGKDNEAIDCYKIALQDRKSVV